MLCSDINLPTSAIETLFTRLCIWFGDLGVPCRNSLEADLEFALTLREAIHATTNATVEESVQHILRTARQKLMDSRTSRLLRVTAYLRLCCQAVHQVVLRDRALPSDNLYLNLIQSLQIRDPQWWVHCMISEDGIYSANPHIQELLQPLLSFVRCIDGNTSSAFQDHC